MYTTPQLNMAKYKTKVIYDWHYFPWNLMGLSIPAYGPVHSYLCTYLAKYGNGPEKLFLPQKPSMRELKRFADNNEDAPLAKDIHAYCERIYGYSKENRDSTPKEVLYYLRDNTEFMKEFDLILAERLRLGYFD